MTDIYEETRDLVIRSRISYVHLAKMSGLKKNWVARFMNEKAETPNYPNTKTLNKSIKDHIASLQG